MNVAFVNSQLINPRLCITITLTFRDDPRLLDLLERVDRGIEETIINETKQSNLDEDEYMVESFDGAWPSPA